MKYQIFEIINTHLAKWNPLNIPSEIAEDEYTDLIPLIIDVLKGKSKNMDKIENYLFDIIGIGFENKKVLKDVENLINTIRNELKDKGLMQ